jgi:hypothetical protein
VTLLSILQTIAGLTFLIDFLVMVAYSSWAGSPEGQARLTEVFSQDAAESIPGLLFILGIIYLALGISTLLLARGLFNGREKARGKARTVAMLAILFAVIGALFFNRISPDRFDIQATWWSIIFNIFVIWYLNRPSVKAFFAGR